MILKKALPLFLLLCIPFGLFAQNSSDEPRGKAIVQVFTNFYSGFGAANNYRGFELDRSYLGYQYQLCKELSIKAVMDIGKSNDVDDYHHIAYIKNAQLTWKKNGWTLNGGMISTTQFNMQEKFWGYRYVMKCFQDEYKFGSSADIGVSVAYQFNPIFSADAIVVNGEGYKKTQFNDGLLYGLGATIQPLEHFTLRLYASLNESAQTDKKDVWNYAAFLGYKTESFYLGAEYNYLQNKKGIHKEDQSGCSAFASLKFCKSAEGFLRYDAFFSKDDGDWENEEQVVMAGAQFKLGKYVKLAPNVRVSIPGDDDEKTICAAYVSCYFGL